MIDLNKEAEEYANNWEEITGLDYEVTSPIECSKIDFIAGANSKYVQAKIIQAQIDVLLKYQQKLGGYDVLSGLLKQEIQIDIYELQQQLKQIENDK